MSIDIVVVLERSEAIQEVYRRAIQKHDLPDTVTYRWTVDAEDKAWVQITYGTLYVGPDGADTGIGVDEEGYWVDGSPLASRSVVPYSDCTIFTERTSSE